MTDTVVLGTGFAAYGAARVLAAEGVPFVCYDKNPYPGGHTATFADGSGFVFDDGPHVSFTKDEEIRALLAENVDGAYQDVAARIASYWHGHWLRHPAQCNLHGLPTDLVASILRDFVDTHAGADPEPRTYAEWLQSAYGRTFAETFPGVYGRKYHTTEPANMTTEWLGPRMYRPDLDEVLRGALGPPATNVHYVTGFRYPTHGGFVSYLRPFVQGSDLRLGHELVGLDAGRRELRFASGAVVAYADVISSIPLPALVPLIEGVPLEVEAAAARLAFTSAVMVNLGVGREDLSDAHIAYFYDEEVIFPRLSFPHMFSPNTVPPGAGSIQAEIYFSDKYRPLDGPLEALIEPVVADLRACGILRDDDAILFREARLARYANVIYDLERAEALATVHAFLDEVGVRYCGRYGDWDHAWTDEAFASGRQAALGALDETRGGRRKGRPGRAQVPASRPTSGATASTSGPRLR